MNVKSWVRVISTVSLCGMTAMAYCADTAATTTASQGDNAQGNIKPARFSCEGKGGPTDAAIHSTLTLTPNNKTGGHTFSTLSEYSGKDWGRNNDDIGEAYAKSNKTLLETAQSRDGHQQSFSHIHMINPQLLSINGMTIDKPTGVISQHSAVCTRQKD